MRVAFIVLLAAAVLGGCASSRSGQVYSRDEARRVMTVEYGTVTSIKEVTIEGTQSGVGATAGAVTGGVLGAGGRNSTERIALGVVGAVVGGVVGSATEELTTRRTGQEIVVELGTGKSIVVVQEADQDIKEGDKVRIIRSGSETRVSK